jgi:hypothetical protein
VTPNIVEAVLIGLGATLLIDLWALFLRRVFSIASLNYGGSVFEICSKRIDELE